MSDFTCNALLNAKMGFTKGSYTYFLPKKIVNLNSKYLIERFLKRKEPISLREILPNKSFKFMVICHLAEFVYMNLKCLPTKTGTYLIIDPADIPADQMEFMRANYNSPYLLNQWTLEIRPKTSYGYTVATVLNGMPSGKIYLDTMQERLSFLDEFADLGDWKVCVGIDQKFPTLLTTSFADLKFDETDGRAYLQVSDSFFNYVSSKTNNVQIFLYNEGHKVGYAISPNYIGPTQYLKTVFDEIFASIDSRRFKVLMQNPEGGWSSLPGTDTKFGNSQNDLVIAGFTPDQCWVCIPQESGVSPIYTGNFRVWEYDVERDCLGRLCETDMEAVFPNIYKYKMVSDSPFVYLEWFRDDESIGEEYDDFTKAYRDYVGTEFSEKLLDGDVPQVFKEYLPLRSYLDSNEFVENIFLFSDHDYRRLKMIELLQNEGLYYDILYDALSARNIPWTTIVVDMSKRTSLFNLIQSGEAITIANGEFHASERDLLCYIDGVLHTDVVLGSRNGYRTIKFPANVVQSNSTIILDLFEYSAQHKAHVNVDEDKRNACIDKDELGIPFISGSELVACHSDLTRVDSAELKFGIKVAQTLIQVPEDLIDWEKLGMTIDDPSLADRIGTDENGFRSVVFRHYFLPDDTTYIYNLIDRGGALILSLDPYMLGVLDTDTFFINGVVKYLKDVDGRCLVCITGDKLTVDGEGADFTKRVPSGLIAVGINDYEDDTNQITLFNCNILRKSAQVDLSTAQELSIDNFYGSDNPKRLLTFVNGELQDHTVIETEMPEKMGDTYQIKIAEAANLMSGTAEIIHLPFNLDRFEVDSDANAQINFTGSGVMCLGIHDMIFENGKRVKNDTFTKYTNQIVKAPNANAHYTIIRVHRDSNFYLFEDTDEQSFMDKLYKQSPGFKQSQGIF